MRALIFLTLFNLFVSDPTTLLNFEDNNHIFKYPQSGQLAIDVYVKGNPEPTNVRLWVRQSDASGTVPVSSQNFRWTYQKTAGAVQSGVIQLTISGGLEDGEISSYTLKAENGVVSESEFEYKFSVNGMDIEGEFFVFFFFYIKNKRP